MIFSRVALDAVNRALEVHEHASGKSVNVARVSHVLGAKSIATGFLGGDRGEFIRRELTDADIAHDFVSVQPQTRLCTTVVDRSAETATELVEESAAVPDHAWPALSQRLHNLLSGARMLVLSGSLPPGAPVTFYRDCVEAAARQGVPAIIDARGLPLRHAMGHAGLTIKLNRDELAATLDRTLTDDDALHDAMVAFAPPGGRMIVTLGASGAVAYEALGNAGGQFYRIRSPKVAAVSAVGSGDAFAAGLAVGLLNGSTLGEACALGAACGAANALTPFSGHVRIEDVERLIGEVATDVWGNGPAAKTDPPT